MRIRHLGFSAHNQYKARRILDTGSEDRKEALQPTKHGCVNSVKRKVVME